MLTTSVGAVGVEMAAELKTVSPETRVVLINSRERLLSAEPLPDEFKDQSLVMLRKGGVETMMSKRMQAVASDSEMKTVTFTDGTELRVSEVINAVSAPKPTTTYLPNEVMTSEGEVEVAANLAFKSSVPKSAYHYAIGDIVARPGIIKRCGGAMHEGHHAAYNMHQHMLADQGLISKPVYKEMANHGPSIGLALGKEAIGYSSETGIMAGEETLGDLFGDDLALRYCYDHMGLDRKRGCSDVAIEPLGEPESAPGKVVQSIPVVSAEA